MFLLHHLTGLYFKISFYTLHINVFFKLFFYVEVDLQLIAGTDISNIRTKRATERHIIQHGTTDIDVQ